MSAYSEKITRAKQQGLYKVADLEGGKEVTHTISHLLEDAIKFDREMDILCFVDTARELSINLTNGDWLIQNFGPDPSDWAGHKVTLYVGEYEFKKGETKQGIRLKRPDGGVTVGAKADPKPPPKNELDDEIPY